MSHVRATGTYLQPTLGDVDINFCDLAKLPKPLSGCLSKKQLDEIRQWVQQYGKSVRQNTTRNFSTKDKPGTLPLNLYQSAPPEQDLVDLTYFSTKASPFNTKTPAQHLHCHHPVHVCCSFPNIQTPFCSKQPTVYCKTIRRCG